MIQIAAEGDNEGEASGWIIVCMYSVPLRFPYSATCAPPPARANRQNHHHPFDAPQGPPGSSGSGQMQQQMMLQQQDGYLSSRAEALQNVEATIVELGSIFTQLAEMVGVFGVGLGFWVGGGGLAVALERCSAIES